MGLCLYARDPGGETSTFSCSRLAQERRLREPVSTEKCSLRVELPGETVEPESCVRVAGVSSGEDRVGLVLKQTSDACGEYRVGFTQA